MAGSTSGAQRASFRSGVTRTALVATLATLIVAPTTFAAGSVTTSATSGATATTVTTTSILPATWLDVETWYLGLVNCTRTGGWVLSDGRCRGYGTGRYSTYVKPLVRHVGISNLVSRPYAKLLAVRNGCSHYLNGDPGYRLRRAGYLSYTWGENIGCRYGYSTVRAAILASHRAFQAEKSTNGGHWRNIKNARFTYIGMGIWKYSGRVRLVTDFYRP